MNCMWDIDDVKDMEDLWDTKNAEKFKGGFLAVSGKIIYTEKKIV